MAAHTVFRLKVTSLASFFYCGYQLQLDFKLVCKGMLKGSDMILVGSQGELNLYWLSKTIFHVLVR